MGSVGLCVFSLRDAGFHQFLDECCWQRLVGGEVDGAFGFGEGLQVVFEFFDDCGGGEQAAVI